MTNMFDAYAALLGSRRNLIIGIYAKKRGSAINRLNKDIKRIVKVVHQNRKPEGDYDRKSRWYPTAIEDYLGSARRVRSPSTRFPYSYKKRCHTFQHCTILVNGWLDNEMVPDDVNAVCTHMFEEILERQGQ